MRHLLLGDCGSGSDAGGFLGDVFCTANEVRAARDAMVRLLDVWKSVGRPEVDRPAVSALAAEWKNWEEQPAFERQLSFCRAKEIGQRAAALADEIARRRGYTPPAPDEQLRPGPTTGLGDTLATAAKVAIAGVAALYLWRSKPAPTKRRATRKP